jgi:hypothetical protein
MADGPTSWIDEISTAQSQKEVTANENFDGASPALFGARQASACVGLTIGLYGGKYNDAGSVVLVANWTQAMTGSASNYVEFDPVLGTFSANTSAFTPGRWPLYKFVTSSSAVTSWTDYRWWGGPAESYLAVAVGGSANVTLNQAQANVDVLSLTGLLTGNINVVLPLQPRERTIFNDTTGAFTLTVIGATGTGFVIGSGKCAKAFADGTNIRRTTPDV